VFTSTIVWREDYLLNPSTTNFYRRSCATIIAILLPESPSIIEAHPSAIEKMTHPSGKHSQPKVLKVESELQCYKQVHKDKTMWPSSSSSSSKPSRSGGQNSKSL